MDTSSAGVRFDPNGRAAPPGRARFDLDQEKRKD
jgi:hypothetical protein